MKLNAYRIYLKTDYIGISVDAESVMCHNEYIHFQVKGRTVVVVAVDRLNKIEQRDQSTGYKAVDILPDLVWEPVKEAKS